MRNVVFPVIVVLLAACASAPDGETTSAASTRDLDVGVVQANEPFLVGNQQTLDFLYQIDVRNQTSEPLTLKRIALSSMGSAGAVRIGARIRPFDREIAPGATESVEFWAVALVQDFTPGHRTPVTLRVRPTIRDASGKERTETFMQRVDATYTVGLVQ